MINKKKILIIGGDSKLAKKFIRKFNNIYEILYTTKKSDNKNLRDCIFLNLSDDFRKWELPDIKFDWILICASITNISYCEKHPKITKKINIEKTLEIIKLFNTKSKIIFFSSNEVLLGSGKTGLPTKKPISEYGRQKAKVEEVILQKYNNTFILRLSKIYNQQDKLFKTWITNLQKNNKIYPFDDLYVSLISYNAAINIIKYIIENKHCPQLIQLSGSKDFSYYNLALELSSHLNSDQSLIIPTSGIGVVNKNRLSVKTSISNTYNPDLFGPIDLKVFY